MPTVSINKDHLYKSLGKNFSDEEFDDLCFQFGIEVDDIVDDPEKGITLKIEIGANRYDLLCIEGISRALKIYLGKQTLPNYKLLPPKSKNEYQIIVKAPTSLVRPYVVGAVLRNMSINQAVYDSFIDLQDKLHHNIARKRTLVAIGTHDLDTINGPFVYDALPPKDISFIPLNQTKAFRGDHLIEHLSHDSHLKEYLPIIKDKPVYPIIKDSNGVVLSLPPIINGDHSKLSLATNNVFIECTGTDKFKTQVVLDTLVCMFSEYCEKPFTVEAVDVVYPNGEVITYPKLETRKVESSVDRCNTLVGVSESAADIAKYLEKMCLIPTASKDGKSVNVEIPPTRYDVLHECDVIEDFAIAYGFDRLTKDMSMPPTNTIGQEFELNYLSDKLRLMLSQNNYTEAATFSLCSKADMGEKLRIDLSKEPWVTVGNPKTTECEAVRNTLLPGILKTLAANKHFSLPIRLFEVADVVVKDSNPELTLGVGARNERHLCAVNYNVSAGVEIILGLLDNVMIALKIPDDNGQGLGYYLERKDHPTFFPGTCASVFVNKIEIGRLGAIHPDVITNFNLNCPAAALILNIQKVFEFSKL